MKIRNLLICIVISSCSFLGEKSVSIDQLTSKSTFNYADKSGKYILKQITSKTEKNEILYKRSLEIPNRDKDHILEQVASISEFGYVKKTPILRPLISQYNVWFNGKKFSSEIKINSKKKQLDIKIVDPEKKNENSQNVSFPHTKTLTCFFSQLIECVKINGYVGKSLSTNQAPLRLQVIWDGFPFFNETLSDFPVEAISLASFSFDGKLSEDQLRFNLETNGQNVFYVINKKMELIKVFWVSQGISLVRSDLKKSLPEEGIEDE